MLTALFGIDDGSLNLAVNLLILVLVVVWLALVYWTHADARRRIGDSVLVATATAASLFPFIGTVVYTILRPPEYLEDARERELETRAAELRLLRLAATSCPRCEYPVELSWLRCPQCQHRLKDPCRECGRPVDPRWSICPHCEAAVAPARAKGKRAASRRSKPAQAESAQAQPARRAAADRQAAGERRAAERRSEQQAPKRRGGGAAGSSSRSSSEGGGEQDREARERSPRRKSPTSTRGNG
jgi:hypothetical protein